MPPLNILTEIGAGLSALKTGADLTRALREGIKSGRLKPDEIASRIGEIYDSIVDSKAALADAKEEISRLHDELRKIKVAVELEESFIFRHGVYWKTYEVLSLRTDPEGERIKEMQYEGPYCPLCKDADQKPVHLKGDGNMQDGTALWYCEIHKTDYVAPTMKG
jgi:hypothetical protein